MKSNLILTLIIFIGVLLSCEKLADWDVYESKEAALIDDYIKASKLSFLKTESGLYYHSKKSGDGESPEIGDFVIYEYTYRFLDSTVIYSTDRNIANSSLIDTSSFIYGPDKAQVGFLPTQGEDEAITLMRENGECVIIVPFKLGFRDIEQEDIPPYSSLLIDLELLEVIHDPVAHEKALIQDYLVQNDGFVELMDGLYYSKLNEGNGVKIRENDEISLNIERYLLDGRLLNSENSTIRFNPENVPIEGLFEGIKRMSEGERGTLIIRSDLAYGDSTHLAIPPYSTLFIDIEILQNTGS